MMKSSFAFALTFAFAGCVDGRCLSATAWKPCATEGAQSGSSGSPPSISALFMPTCGYIESPGAEGELSVDDPDADADVVKITYSFGSIGQRIDADEVVLSSDGRAGTVWQGPLKIVLPQPTAGTFGVRVKVVDREGAQSRPYCNEFTLVR